jgi:hypothetical protein
MPSYDAVVDAAGRLRDGLTVAELDAVLADADPDLAADQRHAIITQAEAHLQQAAPLNLAVESAKAVVRLTDIYARQMAIARTAMQAARGSRSPIDYEDDPDACPAPEQAAVADHDVRRKALADAVRTVDRLVKLLGLERYSRVEAVRVVVLAVTGAAQPYIPPAQRDEFSQRIRDMFAGADILGSED